MLSEPRRRQKWTLNPRGNLWSKDENKLGNKLMEKMGWETGQGLGAKQDGMLEPIQVKKKEDKKGIGHEGHDDTWLAHQDDFQAVLAALNEAHNGGVENEKPKEVDDEDAEKRSLEKDSKKSKRRVHYHKFTRGKDLANYSANDLGSILGTNSAKRNPKPESEPSTPEQEESEEETEKDEKFTVQKSTVQEYFAKKMAELKARGKPVLLPEEYHPVVKASNAKKLDDNGEIVKEKSEDSSVEEVVVKKKKKSKKVDKETCEVEEVTEDAEVKKKKKKSKKNKEHKETSNEVTETTKEDCDMTVEATDALEDNELPKKKKKSKQPEQELKEESSSTDQEDSGQKKKKKKKTKKSKKDKNEEDEVATPDDVQNDSGCEQTEQKTRKKKREKKKKDKVSPHDEDQEEEPARKKSKKEKKHNPDNPLPSNYQELPGFKGSNILAVPGYGTKK